MTEEAIPVYDGQAGVEAAYARAEREGEPFFGIERYENGYAVTYDLLPAGERLGPAPEQRLRERLTAELEAIVEDSELPTDEVATTVNDSLGNVSVLGSEASAHRVARIVETVALDPANWVGES